MANQKVTDLNAITSATTDDLLYVVDAPGTTPVSKKITFDNFQKSLSVLGGAAGVSTQGNIYLPVDKVFYMGDADTDGSIRWSVIDGDLVFEKRISGNWVFKGAMS